MKTQEFLTLVSLTKSTKAINEQLQTNINYFGKVLDYNEEVSEALQIAKPEDDCAEKLGKILPTLPHPLVQRNLALQRFLQRDFTLWGKGQQENPSKSHHHRRVQILDTEDLQSSPALIPFDRAAQSPCFYIFLEAGNVTVLRPDFGAPPLLYPACHG